jgi:hypothetical protein
VTQRFDNADIRTKAAAGRCLVDALESRDTQANAEREMDVFMAIFHPDHEYNKLPPCERKTWVAKK